MIGLLKFIELIKLVTKIVSKHCHQLRIGHVIESFNERVSHLSIKEPWLLSHIQIINNLLGLSLNTNAIEDAFKLILFIVLSKGSINQFSKMEAFFFLRAC